ncbi:MAG: sensor histidine kinase [Chloroflexota bacterium]
MNFHESPERDGGRQEHRANLLILATVLFPLASFFFLAVYLNPQRFSASTLIIVAILSCIYLLLLYTSNYLFDKGQEALKMPYLIVQSIIALLIAVLTEPGFIWIIFMPFISQAVLYFKLWPRWVIFTVVTVSMTLPYIQEDGWNSIFVVFLFIPAVFFVAAFTQVTLEARKRQQVAEGLSLKLESANQQLAEYALQAEELAVIQERNRIAREIHDSLGHYLTVINVQLEAARVLIPSDTDKAVESITKAQTLTKDGLKSIRESIATLRENPITQQPLPDVIQNLIEESRNSGIQSNYDIIATPRPLAANSKLSIYRIVQEALTNVRKHASASEVDVALDYAEPEEIKITVKDNGVGTSRTDSGYGILGINERVKALGGDLLIETAEGEGFQLVITIPG